VSKIGIIPVRVVQADIDAQVDLVILRVPPACVDDLVGVRCGVDGTVRNAVIHAIVTVIIDPVSQAIGPVPAFARVAYPCPRRRRSGWRRRRTVLAGHITGESHDAVIEGVVGCGMIEDRFLGGGTRVRRV
jgi:hypothetical protein